VSVGGDASPNPAYLQGEQLLRQVLKPTLDLLEAGKELPVGLEPVGLEPPPGVLMRGWCVMDPFGIEPLAQAASHGHAEVVALLLRVGAAVDAASPSCGRTALIRTAANGQLATLQLLFEAGASLQLASTDGGTALHHAAAAGTEDAVIMLLKAGAQTEARDANGKTALLVAAEGGHADLCSTLAEEGADVNSSDISGWQALHHALVGDYRDVGLALVRGGLENLTAATHGGSTPLHLNHPMMEEVEEELRHVVAEREEVA
jgi:ankyrin repeat protein